MFAIFCLGCLLCLLNCRAASASDASAPSSAVNSSFAAENEADSATVDVTAVNADSATNLGNDDTNSVVAKSPIRLARISPNNGNEFVQVANFSNDDLSIESLSLKIFNSVNTPYKTDFTLSSGKFLAGQFVVLSSSGSDFGKVLPDETLPNLGGAVQLFVNGELSDEVCWGSSNVCGNVAQNMPSISSGQILQNVALNPVSSSPLNNGSDFTSTNLIDSLTDKPILLGSGGFVADPVSPADPLTNFCVGLTLNEIAANNDQQFVEVKNSTAAPIKITGCQLQTNRSSKTFAFNETTLASGALLSVNLAGTNLTLTKTTSGEVYLLSSDGETKVDEVDYVNLKSGTSFAKFDDGWEQTYNVTPGAENIYEQYLPCASGYERNSETGYCNKIATVELPKVCQVGYFLNEATNRCNKIAETDKPKICAGGYFLNTETNRCNKNPVAKSLALCGIGSVRNPITNRCNKIATPAKSTPCKTGWERNPTTNRCRKIVGDSSTTYPVESLKQSPVETNSVVAAVAILAGTAMVVLWQFREEVSRLFRGIRVKLLARKYYNEMSQQLRKDR